MLAAGHIVCSDSCSVANYSPDNLPAENSFVTKNGVRN